MAAVNWLKGSPGLELPAALASRTNRPVASAEHQLPGGEAEGRQAPGQVREAGPGGPAGPGDHPGQAESERHDQDRLAGQRPVAERDPGQHRASAAAGEDPDEQAGRRDRLGQVVADAHGEAEVAGQQQAAQGVPPRVAGQHAAGQADGAEREDVDGHQRGRHPGVLPG